MKELIEEIKKHQSNNNERICEELIELIESYKVNTKEELLQIENKYFTTPLLDKKIEIMYNEFLANNSYYEFLDNSDLKNLDKYEKKLEESNDTLDKCKYLILIYDYIHLMLYFPYEAYLLIVNDRLKGEFDSCVKDSLYDDE